jgi:hypothetical protein
MKTLRTKAAFGTKHQGLRSLVGLAGAVLALLVFARNAKAPDVGSGQAVKTPFTARLVFDIPDPPAPDARLWIDEGGNLHVRGGRRDATVSGDFEGRFHGVANLDVDAATFVGTGFGTFELDVTWQGKTGAWSGSYSARIDGADFFGRFLAQGSGGLSGPLRHRDLRHRGE